MRMHISTGLLIGFTAVSAVIFSAEFRAFGQASPASLAPTSQPLTKPANYLFSLSATRSTLSACDRKMSVPAVFLQPKSQLLETAANCAQTARLILKWMPTNGLAYLVAAQSADLLGEQANRDRLLGNSVRFARFEGWLAMRRFALIMNPQLPQTPDFSQTLRLDIATLLSTQSGAELLAGYYSRRPDIRALLAQIATRASASEQTRFLNLVRKQQAGL